VPPKGSKKLDAKQAARLRRQQLEEEKRRLARRERMRTWTYAAIGVVAGCGIIAGVLVPQLLKATPIDKRSLASFGSSPSKAGCGSPTAPKSDPDVVIGPGSKDPKKTKGTYRSAPPVGGAHYATPAPTEPHFYRVAQHPKVEQLVANELASQTVIWYLPTLSSSKVKTLDEFSQRLALDNPDFVVAPWDTAYGTFPAGKQVAFATKGHVEYCAGVSGAAAQAFMQQFPAVAATPTPSASVSSSVSPSAAPSGSASATTKPSASSKPSTSRKPSASPSR
jgi:hypothetical protein